MLLLLQCTVAAVVSVAATIGVAVLVVVAAVRALLQLLLLLSVLPLQLALLLLLLLLLKAVLLLLSVLQLQLNVAVVVAAAVHCCSCCQCCSYNWRCCSCCCCCCTCAVAALAAVVSVAAIIGVAVIVAYKPESSYVLRMWSAVLIICRHTQLIYWFLTHPYPSTASLSLFQYIPDTEWQTWRLQLMTRLVEKSPVQTWLETILERTNEWMLTVISRIRQEELWSCGNKEKSCPVMGRPWTYAKFKSGVRSRFDWHSNYRLRVIVRWDTLMYPRCSKSTDYRLWVCMINQLTHQKIGK